MKKRTVGVVVNCVVRLGEEEERPLRHMVIYVYIYSL